MHTLGRGWLCHLSWPEDGSPNLQHLPPCQGDSILRVSTFPKTQNCEGQLFRKHDFGIYAQTFLEVTRTCLPCLSGTRGRRRKMRRRQHQFPSRQIIPSHAPSLPTQGQTDVCFFSPFLMPSLCLVSTPTPQSHAPTPPSIL